VAGYDVSSSLQAPGVTDFPALQDGYGMDATRGARLDGARERERVMAKVKSIPEGSHSITPGLVVKDAKKAIEFYRTALGATVLDVMNGPDGSVMHAELKLGDSKFYLGDENPEWGALSPKSIGGSPVSLNIYTEDCDALIQRAVKGGATLEQPPADMFWGDRYGKIQDPFGHKWGIATHKEDVSKEEMARRGQEWMAQMSKK
jgi:PhnB protein